MTWEKPEQLQDETCFRTAKKQVTRIISLEFFPYFYNLSRSSQSEDAYSADYMVRLFLYFGFKKKGL